MSPKRSSKTAFKNVVLVSSALIVMRIKFTRSSQVLFFQLSCGNKALTMEEYLTYNDILAISVGQIKTDLEDWRKTGREEAITCNIFSEKGVFMFHSSDDKSNEGNKRVIRQTATTGAFASVDKLLSCSQ